MFNELNESSLGRIYQHIQQKNVDSWSIFTSNRSDNSPSKNNKDFIELKSKVRLYDLGFIEMIGYGQEEDKTGNIEITYEKSLFVPNIKQKQVIKLCNIYNQLGYIYCGEETENKIILLINGKKDKELNKFIPNKIAEFYSILNGKPFVFEEILSSTYMEKYYKYLMRK